MKNRKGLTLIEMLVVIAIIAIIAGLITPAALKAREKGMIAKTKSVINQIETAIAMYESDFGDYPPENAEAEYGTDANSVSATGYNTASESLYFYLCKRLTGSSPTKRYGPYMKLRSADTCDSDTDGKEEIADAWGNPIQYDSTYGTAPSNNTYSFDLYSYGPDKNDDSGGDDDINNW